jgi:hypothetical protein
MTLVEYLVERVEKIDGKVDEILKFKWQMLGGGLLLTSTLTVVMQFVFLYLRSKS